jgi:hypothetical protein
MGFQTVIFTQSPYEIHTNRKFNQRFNQFELALNLSYESVSIVSGYIGWKVTGG